MAVVHLGFFPQIKLCTGLERCFGGLITIGLHQRILGSVRFGVGRNPLVVVAVDECQVSETDILGDV
jgi:hypothetical protein